MQKLNSRNVRKAKILKAACEGVPLKTIADENGCHISVVTKAINSPEGQERLQNVITDCEQHINSQLPELLDLSLHNLKKVLTSDFAERNEKIRASEIILKTALKLSQISRT